MEIGDAPTIAKRQEHLERIPRRFFPAPSRDLDNLCAGSGATHAGAASLDPVASASVDAHAPRSDEDRAQAMIPKRERADDGRPESHDERASALRDRERVPDPLGMPVRQRRRVESRVGNCRNRDGFRTIFTGGCDPDVAPLLDRLKATQRRSFAAV